MKIKTFFDFINEKDHSDEIGSYAETFLRDWTAGESSALRILNKRVMSDLRITLEKDEYVLYRGLKINDDWEVEKIFGKPFNKLKPGKASITFDGPTSWTVDLDIANKFGNPYFDSFRGRYFSYNQILNMGYNDGDLLSFGLVIKAIIPKTKLIADLTNIKKIVKPKEKEMIVQSLDGFSVEILSKKEYLLNYTDSNRKTK